MKKVNYMREPAPALADAVFWQGLYRRAQQAAEALKEMYDRRKPHSIERDALWEGYYACRKEAKEMVEHAHKRGKLLTMFMPD